MRNEASFIVPMNAPFAQHGTFATPSQPPHEEQARMAVCTTAAEALKKLEAYCAAKVRALTTEPRRGDSSRTPVSPNSVMREPQRHTLMGSLANRWTPTEVGSPSKSQQQRQQQQPAEGRRNEETLRLRPQSAAAHHSRREKPQQHATVPQVLSPEVREANVQRRKELAKSLAATASSAGATLAAMSDDGKGVLKWLAHQGVDLHQPEPAKPATFAASGSPMARTDVYKRDAAAAAPKSKQRSPRSQQATTPPQPESKVRHGMTRAISSAISRLLYNGTKPVPSKKGLLLLD